MNQEINYKQMSQDSDIQPMNKTVTPVKKRNDKGNFKDRFSKIVSVYIPNDDAEKVLLRFDDDMEPEIQDHYPKTLLQCLDDGLCYQVELLGGWQNILGRKGGRVQCSCVYKSILFMAFEDEMQIFRLSLSETGVTSDSIWFPKVQSFSISPIGIQCTNDAIYVSGKINFSDEQIQYIIVKYDMDENVIAYTRRYTYPKFDKFDIDNDGNLIILSPQIDEDGMNSQISKLSSEFNSRQYYITLGDQQSRYVPLHVAAHGTANKAWVSMKKQSTETDSKTEYRIMCFRCCIKKTDGDKNQLRTALESSRWRMAGFSLGPLVVLDDHILAIDEELHNLCYISWNEVEGHPVVKKISAPNSPNLINMCSDGSDYAYLFTEHSVFRFRFQEQLIKDSELLV